MIIHCFVRNKEPPDRATNRNRALRALGRREHSALELRRKLAVGGADKPDAEQIVEELQEAGFQSDERFAEMLVRSRSHQGYGPLRVAADMAARGIDREISRAAMEQANVDWIAIASDLYSRRFPQPAANYAERNKRWRFLAARGFSGDQIKAALKAAVDDPIDDDSEPEFEPPLEGEN